MRVWSLRSTALLLATAALLAGSGDVSAAAPSQECSQDAVRSAVVRFTAAYNTASLLELDALFAAEPEFQWYSANAPGLRVRAAAFRRDTLLSYFRARYRQGDRLRLLRFRFNGNSNGYGHFDYRFQRRARDFRGGAPFLLTGKGAATCAGSETTGTGDPPRFVVMSLGGPEPK